MFKDRLGWVWIFQYHCYICYAAHCSDGSLVGSNFRCCLLKANSLSNTITMCYIDYKFKASLGYEYSYPKVRKLIILETVERSQVSAQFCKCKGMIFLSFCIMGLDLRVSHNNIFFISSCLYNTRLLSDKQLFT